MDQALQAGLQPSQPIPDGTPGMLLSATALLQRNDSPSEEEVRIGLSGNHRPSAYYAAAYCAYPVTSSEAEQTRASIRLRGAFVSTVDTWASL